MRKQGVYSLHNVDFVIEVYRLGNEELGYLYRLIPVGKTYIELNRSPDFIFKGALKPGYHLDLNEPIITLYITITPQSPGEANET